MSQAVAKLHWQIAASHMALLANVNRDPKKHRPFRAADFEPFTASKKAKPMVDISVLKDVFIDGKMPKGMPNE